jgi:hypothetical protein
MNVHSHAQVPQTDPSVSTDIAQRRDPENDLLILCIELDICRADIVRALGRGESIVSLAVARGVEPDRLVEALVEDEAFDLAGRVGYDELPHQANALADLIGEHARSLVYGERRAAATRPP